MFRPYEISSGSKKYFKNHKYQNQRSRILNLRFPLSVRFYHHPAVSRPFICRVSSHGAPVMPQVAAAR